jgi:transposase
MDESRRVTTCVGIDVSKARLDVHMLPSGEAFAVARDDKGLESLVERLTALDVSLIVLEATGGFETMVAAVLAGAGLPLAVVNPRQIRSFAKALGKLAKTDAIDAEVIALFADKVRPQVRPVPTSDARALGELVARRRQIVEMIGMEANRRRHAADKRLAKDDRSPPRFPRKGTRRRRRRHRHGCARFARVARNGRLARFRSRRRPGDRANPHRRVARTRQPRSPKARRPRRRRAVQPRFRSLARPSNDRRRKNLRP